MAQKFVFARVPLPRSITGRFSLSVVLHNIVTHTPTDTRHTHPTTTDNAAVWFPPSGAVHLESSTPEACRTPKPNPPPPSFDSPRGSSPSRVQPLTPI
ncbi:hypothetical protein CGRA01v4_02281 [Colletotrichum graminicola]|nr:hypothetical protein CGRA01v4_02281 [Colletotrichum graminicola]